MKSTVSEGFEPKNGKMSKILKTSLALVLIVFAFTMSSPSSFFQIVKPVMAAGTITSIAIMPSNNIVSTRTTYEVMFKTATTGTIKTIHMTFPNDFDLSAATRIIEKSGIGAGSLSLSCSISSCDLKYIVSSPVSVPAGTSIRLEIGRIINSDTAGSFKVGISTEAQVTLDGPTQSPSFPIKAIGSDDIADNSIKSNDVSPSFMKKIRLFDDASGHTHGWDPDNTKNQFDITGISGVSVLTSAVVAQPEQVGSICSAIADNGGFHVKCDVNIQNDKILDFTVINSPPVDENLITSSSSAMQFSPSQDTGSQDTGSQDTGSQDTGSQDTKSINTLDDIASEFP